MFNVFKSCVKNCVIPIQWRYAKEIYIPKSKTPSESNIKDFRPIALLNVEGKLLFSLISKRLEAHLIANNGFINTSIQKGCMEKVPGCWEHMSTVWSALKEARSNKSDLATIWLDIANAYGSVPHKLIFFALKRYGVHDHWISLVQNYYVGIYSKSFSESAPSNWHQHQRGIFCWLYTFNNLVLGRDEYHLGIRPCCLCSPLYDLQQSIASFSKSFYG